VHLRPARPEDWPRAWAIQSAAFADLVERAWGGWTAEMEAECAADWVADQVRMIVVDGDVVGWVQVVRHADHDWLELVNLHPDAQGQGLGTRVMRLLMDEATARGVPLWLSVYRINAARRLYARLGFKTYPRDEIRVRMVFPADAPADLATA